MSLTEGQMVEARGVEPLNDPVFSTPASAVTVPADPDDDFNESLGERQPGANDAIVCEGGCQ